MLNNNGVRELAYLVTITNILPIEGATNVELAQVNGWNVLVHKNQFQIGDLAIYFEIDSKVPADNPAFAFLEKYHYKIKTQKYFKGKVVSQGLLMSPADFGWKEGIEQFCGNVPYVEIAGNHYTVGAFLTSLLGVTYADPEDNVRKAPSIDKYKKMSQRHPKIFKTKIARWFMKREWGKKFMFALFGKPKDKRNGWPEWVKKTDEERCQNMPFLFTNPDPKETWIVTEKIDGTSTTATYRKGKKYGFYICSRNVVFDKPDKKCFYEKNVYTEMAEKYHFEEVLKDIVKKFNLEWATIQGETYGDGIQKRDYGLDRHDFVAFNLIFSDRGRIGSVEARAILGNYNIPWVPILNTEYTLPNSVEEMLNYAASATSRIDGGMREGVVLRSPDGLRSFKAVSNEFLMKFHQ